LGKRHAKHFNQSIKKAAAEIDAEFRLGSFKGPVKPKTRKWPGFEGSTSCRKGMRINGK